MPSARHMASQSKLLEGMGLRGAEVGTRARAPQTRTPGRPIPFQGNACLKAECCGQRAHAMRTSAHTHTHTQMRMGYVRMRGRWARRPTIRHDSWSGANGDTHSLGSTTRQAGARTPAHRSPLGTPRTHPNHDGGTMLYAQFATTTSSTLAPCADERHLCARPGGAPPLFRCHGGCARTVATLEPRRPRNTPGVPALR